MNVLEIDWRKKLGWFAAELLIVVSGVLIALALNAWVQGLAESKKAAEYLTQFAADLEETERDLTEVIQYNAASAARIDTLLSLFEVSPPPEDFQIEPLLGLLLDTPRPLTGTGRALVETGDLRLLSNDSLKAVIVKYVDVSQAYQEERRRMLFEWISPAYHVVKSQTGYFARGTHPHAVSPSSALGDPEFYMGVQQLIGALNNLMWADGVMRDHVIQVKDAVLREGN